jgi:Domain of unknown function (DUF4177)
MKKQIRCFLLASVLALAFTGCATSSHSSAWEYKVVTEYADATKLEAQINDITQQGWRLVSVAAGGGGPTTVPTTILVFKKHK